MPSMNILPEFQEFLLAKKLVPEKNVYFYALWVNRFLTFTQPDIRNFLSHLALKYISPML